MITFFASIFTALLIKQLLTLLGLILLQVLLAVALAIREKKFRWAKLADFYRTMVVPMIIGWLAFVLVARLITAELLGPQYGILIGDGVTWLSWLAVVASLGARIIEISKILYGNLLPFGEPVKRDPHDPEPSGRERLEG